MMLSASGDRLPTLISPPKQTLYDENNENVNGENTRRQLAKKPIKSILKKTRVNAPPTKLRTPGFLARKASAWINQTPDTNSVMLHEPRRLNTPATRMKNNEVKATLRRLIAESKTPTKSFSSDLLKKIFVSKITTPNAKSMFHEQDATSSPQYPITEYERSFEHESVQDTLSSMDALLDNEAGNTKSSTVYLTRSARKKKMEEMKQIAARVQKISKGHLSSTNFRSPGDVPSSVSSSSNNSSFALRKRLSYSGAIDDQIMNGAQILKNKSRGQHIGSPSPTSSQTPRPIRTVSVTSHGTEVIEAMRPGIPFTNYQFENVEEDKNAHRSKMEAVFQNIADNISVHSEPASSSSTMSSSSLTVVKLFKVILVMIIAFIVGAMFS